MSIFFSEAIIGAGIGSTITLFGIIINNWFQLRSANISRKRSLKTDIFLSTVEHLMRRRLLLVKIPSLSNEEMENLATEGGSAVAKLSVVADNDTIKAVNKLSVAYTDKLFKLLPKRLPIENLRAEVKILTAQLDGNFQRQNRMLNEMVSFNKNGIGDPNIWREMKASFDNCVSQASSLRQSLSAKNEMLNREVALFSASCLSEAMALTDLEVTAVSCLRKELKLPFDEDEYRALTIESSNEVSTKYDDLVKKYVN